jgi:N-acetylglucosamine-6-sulfatase
MARADRRELVWIVALLAGVVPTGLGAPEALADQTRASAAAPNVVLVLVDDQGTNSFKRRFMPRTFANLVDHGTTFTNALAAPPDCCPDRAGILTGQYPHNHGVFSDDFGYQHLVDPQNTLPVWLQRAGYRTGIMGKFLNKYRGNLPAPGFDRWFVGSGTYFGYRLSDNGTQRYFGYRRRDYSTDVLTREAKGFVRGSSPFFLWLAYNAPHMANRRYGHPHGRGPCRGHMPEPPTQAAYRRVRNARLPRSPGFNEAAVSDKPSEIRPLPRLDRSARKLIHRRWRCTLATMSQVDRDLDKLMAELRRDGQLSRTIVIYLSDNGFFFGEHRIPNGKGFPYEEALRVPFVVRVPRAFRPRHSPHTVRQVVSNQDIAPTMLDYANAQPCANECRRMDGHSLVPLLGGDGEWPTSRGVLAEINARARTECACAYEAIRTKRYLFDEYSTGDRELYDLRADPGERRNLAGSHSARRREKTLAARLSRLRRCSGVIGRDPGPVPCE